MSVVCWKFALSLLTYITLNGGSYTDSHYSCGALRGKAQQGKAPLHEFFSLASKCL